MEDTASYLKTYEKLIDDHLESLRSFLINDKIKNIGWEYGEAKNNRYELPLNAFTMISDLYYRENFHSDIIKIFLYPTEKHKMGNVFLFLFIDLLNNLFGNKVEIQKRNYQSAVVEREQEKIDIRVKSEQSKHCILIENKINNAVDMPRQLPRYYDCMSQQGYTVDAIVYLPLDTNKTPDQSSWSKTDKEHVLPKLCNIPAYNKNGYNLVDDWLLPCAQKTNDINCMSILKQYAELIKFLSYNNMDNIILGKFYQNLIEEKNIDTAISVKNMIAELPIYMADRLVETFNSVDKDYKVWKYRNNFCGLIFENGNRMYKIDIWTGENGYKIYVFDQNEKVVFDNFKSLKGFELEGKQYTKSFTFYEEAKVIDCVKPIIEELEERINN